MDKEIKQILIDNLGWVRSENGKIERFRKNGEMASVEWFRQGNTEFNGKYVVMIRYEN